MRPCASTERIIAGFIEPPFKKEGSRVLPSNDFLCGKITAVILCLYLPLLLYALEKLFSVPDESRCNSCFPHVNVPDDTVHQFKHIQVGYIDRGFDAGLETIFFAYKCLQWNFVRQCLCHFQFRYATEYAKDFLCNLSWRA